MHLRLWLAAICCFCLSLSLATAVEDQAVFLRIPTENFDASDLSGTVQAALHSYEGSLIRQTSTRALEDENSGDNVEKDEKCCHCVNDTAHEILRVATEIVEKHCEKAESRYIKEKCRYLRHNKDVAKGIIMALIMTHTHAYAYCVGTDDCELNITSSIEELYWRRLMSYEVEASLMFKYTPTLSEIGYAGLYVDGFSQRTIEDADSGEVCRACIQYMSSEVLHRVVERVKEHCVVAKDEHHKKWCKWAKKNPDVALGHLIVVMRPGEFACGYCHGREACGKDRE